ncbi:hypothetical protein SDC9_195243 [bioreactor metagenome]|uniref:Uncharacterized protein n=1 Tax=bioreactor metagenome TaxID=1076179 RepID=A0A645I955_9ZZZZ
MRLADPPFVLQIEDLPGLINGEAILGVAFVGPILDLGLFVPVLAVTPLQPGRHRVIRTQRKADPGTGIDAPLAQGFVLDGPFAQIASGVVLQTLDVLGLLGLLATCLDEPVAPRRPAVVPPPQTRDIV